MQEQLISFETAKLAKEKGFDWKVRYSYGHKINPHIAYPKEDYSIPSDFNSPNIGQNWSHLYSAPTQSLLQKWLREIHNIDILVTTINGRRLERYVSKIYINKLYMKLVGHSIIYENTFEKGLYQALKLIELCENKI